MGDDADDPIAALRRRAEAMLQSEETSARVTHIDANVVHELEVHKAELEIQNEELRRARVELEESRDRYFSLFDLAPVGFLTTDARGTVEAANRVAAHLLGRPRSALVGRRLADCVSAAETPAVEQFVRALLDADATHGASLEVQTIDERGEAVIVRLHGMRRALAGASQAWITVEDMTAHRRTERALVDQREFAERLLNSAPLVAIELDLESRLVRCNRFFEEITGYTQDEVRGLSWIETFIPERQRNEISRLFEAATGGVRTRGNVNPIVTRAGDERLIEWYDTWVSDDDGQVSGLLAIGLDITEARELEARAEHAQRMEALGTLAAGVSHDFNNLLTGVVGVLDLALRRTTDDAVRPLLEMIRTRMRSGSDTVAQLMTLSRRSSTVPEELRLDAAVGDVTAMLEVILGADITLAVHLGCGSARVRVGRGQLEQIVTNLALNARQAMPHGGKITIRTELVFLGEEASVDSPEIVPGQFARIEVVDTGEGMDESTRRRVFEPFFTTRSAHEGTGLGLATVYGIVRSAGGRVRVESAPGAGSTFWVELPRVRDSQTGLAAVEPIGRSASGETVLLVDDEELVRIAVRHYLEEAGYAVLEAVDASQALELLLEPGTDIAYLVSDVVLPGTPGTELAALARQHLPDLRVVLMSAHSGELLREQGRVAPETLLLEKPFTQSELWAALKRAGSRPGS